MIRVLPRGRLRRRIVKAVACWYPTQSGCLLLAAGSFHARRPASVLLLNCGLHDVKRPASAEGYTQPQVDIGTYRRNLERIVKLAQASTPNANSRLPSLPRWHFRTTGWPTNRPRGTDVATADTRTRPLCTICFSASSQEELGVQVVWVRTMMVDDDLHLRRRGADFTRRDADVMAYNAVADEVMAAASVPSIDMYALSREMGACIQVCIQ